MEYRAECWFPTMTHIVQTEPDEKIKDYCFKKRKENPVGEKCTNVNGYQSPHMYGEFERTETGTIKSPHWKDTEKDPVIKPALYKILKESVCNVLESKLVLMNYWINFNGKGGYNRSHNHPQAHFSGVYYVQAPENCGRIFFDNPHTFTAFDELSSYKRDFIEQGRQHKTITVDPRAGLLILFPAYLIHSVEENKSDEERISIAFNCHSVPYRQTQFY